MASMRAHLTAIVALLFASAALGSPAWAGEEGKDPDGRYEGAFKSPGGGFGEVTFTVKGDGRSLDRFGGGMIGVCYQPGRGPQSEPFRFFIGRVKVDRRGRFSRAFTVKQEPYDQEYVLEGALKGRKVTGHLALDGLCAVSAEFTAVLAR